MYGRMGATFANAFKVVPGNVCGAAITAAAMPASGSFVDVKGYERVHILLQFGAIAGSDAPVLTPKCSDAINGTLDVIDATLAHTAADDDDNEWVAWTIEVGKLPADHHFLSLVASGTLVGTYGSVIFLLESLEVPIATYTALPTASRYVWAG